MLFESSSVLHVCPWYLTPVNTISDTRCAASPCLLQRLTASRCVPFSPAERCYGLTGPFYFRGIALFLIALPASLTPRTVHHNAMLGIQRLVRNQFFWQIPLVFSSGYNLSLSSLFWDFSPGSDLSCYFLGISFLGRGIISLFAFIESSSDSIQAGQKRIPPLELLLQLFSKQGHLPSNNVASANLNRPLIPTARNPSSSF